MPRASQRNDHLTRTEFLAFVKQMERRFEQVDHRFEQVFVELKDQREEFRAQREELRAQREEIMTRGGEIRSLQEELKDQRHWVEVVVGGFQRRAGRNLEEMVAGCLRVALDMSDIRKENLKMRQKFVDDKGEIGPPGREYEIDLCASDGKSFFFEIKSYAESEDVERFADKADLAARKWGRAGAGLVFVTMEKGGEVAETCLRLGVTLA